MPTRSFSKSCTPNSGGVQDYYTRAEINQLLQLQRKNLTDANISPNAEISVSKLANGTPRQLLQTSLDGTTVSWTSNVYVPGTLDVSNIATFGKEICVGIDTPRTDFLVAAGPGNPPVPTKPGFQIESDNQDIASLSILAANRRLPRLNIGSYSGPLGGAGLLSLGDSVASIRFVVGDGTAIRLGTAGAIQAVVDDLPIAGDGGTPLRLNLGVGKLTIKPNGNILIGNTTGTERLSVTGNIQLTDTANSFKVGSNNVVGSRKTGWTAPTGTSTRTTFDPSSVTTAQLAERVKALIDDLTSHGLIGT